MYDLCMIINIRPGVEMVRVGRGSRTRTYLTLDGVRLQQGTWAKRVGLNYATLQQRIALGWDVRRALRTPVDKTQTAVRKDSGRMGGLVAAKNARFRLKRQEWRKANNL